TATTSVAAASSATWCERLKSANIDGIDRHVRASRRIRGGAHLRLILNSRLIESGAEVDQRFFLLDAGERVRNIFQRIQTAVRIETVVLRVVGGERIVGHPIFGRGCPCRSFFEAGRSLRIK